MKKIKKKIEKLEWQDWLVLGISIVAWVIIIIVSTSGKTTAKEPQQTQKEHTSFSNSRSIEYTTKKDKDKEYEWEAKFREEVSAQVDITPQYIDLGRFQLTVYTPESDGGKWGYRTATGVRSQHLATCAVDPTVIPYGTIIVIGGTDGLRLKAVDCGSGVKGKQIDIFFDGTERHALQWLMDEFGDYAEVWKEVTQIG